MTWNKGLLCSSVNIFNQKVDCEIMFEVYVYCKESVLQRKRERAVNIVLFFQLEKEEKEETICYERTLLLTGW